MHNFEEVVTKAKEFGRIVISVAAAQDKEVLEAVKAAIEAVNQAFYPIATKMYQQPEGAEGAGFDPNAAAGNAQSAPHDDNVVDADFKVDEDK